MPAIFNLMGRMHGPMDSTEEAILGWTRTAVLFVAMGMAAWMDHNDRRVPNEHWIEWSKPAIFIWALDLMVQGADWTVYLTASAVVAYASTSVLGRATLRDARDGSVVDRVVLVWYAASMIGVVAGALAFQSTTPMDVVLDDGDAMGILWWKTLGVGAVIAVVDLAWRFRLLHGGADAKALMWVALLFPSWATVPLSLSSVTDEALVVLPVALALLMWGGLAFFAIPCLMLVKNALNGHIRTLADLRLAWHATRIPLDDVQRRHVWLLTSTMAMPDGSVHVVNTARAPRFTPSADEVALQVEGLANLGVEKVWVSMKIPLLVFLWPAMVPLVLFGEPTALLLSTVSP